jgi:hypothetical protein
MHAIRSSIVTGLVALAAVACGDSKKGQPAGGGAPSQAEAGSGAIGDGEAGAESGGAGAPPLDTGGSAGAAGSGAAGGAGTNGGGTPSAGSAGEGPAAGANGGGASSGGASSGGVSSGGASNGGASNGGASSGGTSPVAGAGGLQLIEPPPGCQSVRQLDDAERCEFEYKCDGRTHFDNCTVDIDGVWACECGTFSTALRYFELEGVAGLEACSVIARICESEPTVSPTTTCRTKERAADDSTCSAHATCGNAVDAGPGLLVRAVEHFRTRCELTNDPYYWPGTLRCSCEGGAFDRDRYQLTAPSPEEGCDSLLDFCVAGEEPVVSGRLCSDGVSGGIVEQACPSNPACQGCAMSQQCTETSSIGREVSLIGLGDQWYRSVVCRPQDGELQCSCETTVEGIYGDETVPAEILDLCTESREVCAP